MSAIASRSSYRVADEQEWLESSVNVDPSPASVWAPDYEEEDETTLQSARVDAQCTGLMSPNIEQEESVVDTPSQVRLLDESQVLPGEASFATVRLNQLFEDGTFKPPDSYEPISTSTVDDNRERPSASRVRSLDESQVLTGEASFATVLGELTIAQRHSPITEFLVKTKLSLKQLVLAVLALFSVLALGVFVLVFTISSEVVKVSSAPPPTNPVATNQSVATSNTEAPASVLNSQGKESGTANPTQAVATAKEMQSVAETKLIETPSSDDSRKAPPKDAKSVAVNQEILRDPREHVIETKKQSTSAARKALKEPAVVKTPNATVRSEPSETRPEPATTQKEVPVIVENVEAKTPTITGGGERPRTVTRKPSP